MSKGRHIGKKKAALQGEPVVVVPALAPAVRCRATHDVPYTLRCVLEVHPVRAVDGAIMHKDKKGNWWETIGN